MPHTQTKTYNLADVITGGGPTKLPAPPPGSVVSARVTHDVRATIEALEAVTLLSRSRVIESLIDDGIKSLLARLSPETVEYVQKVRAQKAEALQQ